MIEGRDTRLRLRGKGSLKAKLLAVATLMTVFAAAPPTAAAADDTQFQRLALCRDSWLDWKSDDAKMSALVDYFETRLVRDRKGAGGSPKASTQVLGLPVIKVYPQSVGMGVGFSLVVDAEFSRARAAIEQQLGKPMACAASDGMRSCDLSVGAQRTAILMTGENGNAKTSLVGCYYYYEK